MVAFRIAEPSDRERITGAYAAFGYRPGAAPEDTVWLAEAGDQIVGVVRIAPEHGTLVLRGMRVAQARQRRGIGTQLLANVTAWLGDQDCYCVPYSHLAAFYGYAGFEVIEPNRAPEFLAARGGAYRALSLDVILMLRRRH